MIVEDLIGFKVWVELPGMPEQAGFIASIPHAVNPARIEDSIRCSTFTIEIASDDVVEIEGCFISRFAIFRTKSGVSSSLDASPVPRTA